jgi:large subunit ribosomal protein L17
MKKLRKGRKFSRKTDQRKALIRSLLVALFTKEKMRTTMVKAKEISGMADKIITKAKKGDLSSRRVLSGIFTNKLTKKIMSEIGPRYKGRAGGYTRVVKLGARISDAAKMAIIELVK